MGLVTVEGKAVIKALGLAARLLDKGLAEFLECLEIRTRNLEVRHDCTALVLG
jgi:hypothetical protein